MNKLHLYTGDGKGKTTAAMGLALRCIGHGGRALVGQFLKDGTSGELAALRQLAGAHVMPCPPMKGFVAHMSQAEHAAAMQTQTAYIRSLLQAVEELRPDCIILDELSMALSLGMVPEDAACELIDTALVYGETIVTGYCAPTWLMDTADYVTCMEAERHPYQTERLPARKGVEW